MFKEFKIIFKNLLKFKGILKIWLKIKKVVKIFNKSLENFNTNPKKILISKIIANWGVESSPSFANFSGLREPLLLQTILFA